MHKEANSLKWSWRRDGARPSACLGIDSWPVPRHQDVRGLWVGPGLLQKVPANRESELTGEICLRAGRHPKVVISISRVAPEACVNRPRPLALPCLASHSLTLRLGQPHRKTLSFAAKGSIIALHSLPNAASSVRSKALPLRRVATSWTLTIRGCERRDHCMTFSGPTAWLPPKPLSLL